MTRARAVATGIAGLAALCSVLTLWLLLSNPTIDDTSQGDDYPCNATYDIVLNDPDNVPGGEPPPDAEDTAARCVAAGEQRFDHAIGTAVASVVLWLAAGGITAHHVVVRRVGRANTLV